MKARFAPWALVLLAACGNGATATDAGSDAPGEAAADAPLDVQAPIDAPAPDSGPDVVPVLDALPLDVLDAATADEPAPPTDSGPDTADSGRNDAGCPFAFPTRCGMSCIDTTRNNRHCGECNNRCASGLRDIVGTCSEGRCMCPPGDTLCGNECADLTTDHRHCGACGNECSSTTICRDSACR